MVTSRMHLRMSMLVVVFALLAEAFVAAAESARITALSEITAVQISKDPSGRPA